MRPFSLRVLFKVREMSMKQILYSSLKLLLIISFINAMHSCRNTCEPSCCGGEAKSNLYFTALSESDGVPLIFEASQDLSNFKIIRENARIFSAPAENGDFTFSRENPTSGKTEIYLANLSNATDKNVTEIIPNGNNFDYTYPVINPIGGDIALNSQDNKLYMYSYGNQGVQFSIVSSALLPKSAASFSPDGKWIACFSGMYPNISLNIYEVSNIGGVSATYSLNNVIDNRKGQVIAGWSDDNNSLCFAFDELLGQDTVKSIYVVDIAGNLLRRIENNVLGFQQASFSPANMDEILFVSNSGDIWIADKSSSETLFRKLSDNLPGEINANPNWSHNAQQVVFTKFFDDSREDSELYMLDVNTKGEMLISNQAFSAYWRR